ncbi:unnamed protein product [Urochloa humidicola]
MPFHDKVVGSTLPQSCRLIHHPPPISMLTLSCFLFGSPYLSSQNVVDHIRTELYSRRINLRRICERLCNRCIASGDNTTVILVQFKDAPPPAAEENLGDNGGGNNNDDQPPPAPEGGNNNDEAQPPPAQGGGEEDPLLHDDEITED